MQVPDGLGVRIPGFHPGGPGSIPGLGEVLLQIGFRRICDDMMFIRKELDYLIW